MLKEKEKVGKNGNILSKVNFNNDNKLFIIIIKF